MLRRLLLITLLPLWILIPASAQTECPLGWSDQFGSPGGDGSSTVMAAYDDGSGPSMYYGGEFIQLGTVRSTNLARFDGLRWQVVGGLAGHQFGDTDFYVRALVSHDDGNGPRLYVGGRFQDAGGQSSDLLASWDGNSWAPTPGGAGGLWGDYVSSLHSHPAPGGSELIVGGAVDFPTSDGVARNLASWDGTQWKRLGPDLDFPPGPFASLDTGSGSELYGVGAFTGSGGSSIHGVARWDGTNWNALGGGLPVGAAVAALEVFDDGSGPALYVSGSFSSAGGIPVNNVARWDGTTWSAVGAGLSGKVIDLQDFPDDSTAGHRLYASVNGPNASPKEIRAWDGTAWHPVLPTGVEAELLGGHLAVTDYLDGRGPLLHAAFRERLDTPTLQTLNRKLVFDGTQWDELSDDQGLLVTTGKPAVHAMVEYEDGLAVAGRFSSGGGRTLRSVGKWNGHSWEPLGQGLSDDYLAAKVFALASFDDGSGSGVELYAGGDFNQDGLGPIQFSNIAKFDGTAWQDVGGGSSKDVRALLVHDDGSGPALYAAGEFQQAGGAPAERIARWNGTSWAPVGVGFAPAFRVNALCEFDFGAGPRLVAAGGFSASGGTALGNVAVWDGASWSPLGFADDEVFTLHVSQLGGGAPRLFMGGDFDVADGQFVNGVAEWTGSSWSSVGANLGAVRSLGSFGDTLYAGDGSFTFQRISKWSGGGWGTLAIVYEPGGAYVMHAFDDQSPSGPGLFIGGSFDSLGYFVSYAIGKYAAACPLFTHCEAAPNSVGDGALISSSGSPSVSLNDFTLEARHASPNQWGKFYYGPGALQLPFGDGYRCIGEGLIGTFRLYPPALTDSTGFTQRLVDFGAHPAGSGPGAITPGSTFSFQYWYRDPFGPGGTGFNLSNALRATFLP